MKVAIYTRVSSEEQVEGYSLSAQEVLARRFAEAKEWEVVTVYEEPGRSGKSDLRPAFQQMIRDAEAHQFDVILVHKLDRFSRNVLDVLGYLKRLNDHDVSFTSVSEDFDFTTPMGKVMLTMLAAFAEWYLTNLSSETSKGKKERARKGDWNGTLPFGYTTLGRLRKLLADLGEQFRTEEIDKSTYSQNAEIIEQALDEWSGLHDTAALPCPFNAEGARYAFALYVSGLHSDSDIASRLNAAGYRTTGQHGSNPFGKDTVRDMLQSRFYLGQTSYKGGRRGSADGWNPGNHRALITQDLFDRCQEVRHKRAEAWGRGAPNSVAVYPLASLIECLDCGCHWIGQRQHERRYYRDPAKERGIKCSTKKKSVQADSIEKQMQVFLLDCAQIPDDWKEQALQLMQTESPDAARIQTEERALRAKLERLKELRLEGDIDKKTYQSRRDEIQRQIAALPKVGGSTMVDMERAAELLSDLRLVLEKTTLEEQTKLYRALVTKAYVRDGEIKAIEPTRILWALFTRILDTRFGDDGVRTRGLCLDRAVC